MSRYSITKKRAQSLECYRTNNGPYNSVEDLLQVKGMNNNCLHKFYKSIVCGKKRTGPKKITRGLVLTPKTTNQKVQEIILNFQIEILYYIYYYLFSLIPVRSILYEILQDVNTVLGIYIGTDMISWSLLNRDCEVLQWSYKCFPQSGLKENIHSLLQIVSNHRKLLTQL